MTTTKQGRLIREPGGAADYSALHGASWLTVANAARILEGLPLSAKDARYLSAKNRINYIKDALGWKVLKNSKPILVSTDDFFKWAMAEHPQLHGRLREAMLQMGCREHHVLSPGEIALTVETTITTHGRMYQFPADRDDPKAWEEHHKNYFEFSQDRIAELKAKISDLEGELAAIDPELRRRKKIGDANRKGGVKER